MFLRVAEFTVTKLCFAVGVKPPCHIGRDFYLSYVCLRSDDGSNRVTGFGSVVAIASNVSFLLSCALAGAVDMRVYRALWHCMQRERAGHMLTGAVYHQED